MKFLFVSDDGSSCGIARRVAAEGNEVAVAIRDPRGAAVCDGLVEKITDWKFDLDAETNVIFDCTGQGWMADLLRRRGQPCCCGAGLFDRLENDRRFAYALLRRLGIEQPRSWWFTDFEAAREFVAGDGKAFRLVFKPCGEHSGNQPSYVSSGSDDLLEMLFYFEREWSGPVDFMLQEFVEGVEVSTELWFCDGSPLLPANHTFETKHLMDGDRGPSGGCTGNVVWACDWDWVCRQTLEKLLPLAREQRFSGPLDINAVVTNEQVYALEFTPRWGYDATPTLLTQLLGEEQSKFLAELCRGQAHRFPARDGFAGAVRLSVAPWPSQKFLAPPGIPVRGVPDFEQFYPYDVQQKDGRLETCGVWGIVGLTFGRGDSPGDAMTAAAAVAGKIRVPDLQVRGDLARVFSERFGALQSLQKEVLV